MQKSVVSKDNLREQTELLTSRTQYILMCARRDGNMAFDGHMPVPAEKSNEAESRNLCRKIERQLQNCSPAEIPVLLSCYSILYLVGYRQMPPADFIERYRTRVIRAWTNGYSGIEESDVFGLISMNPAHNSGRTDADYAAICSTLREKWLESLSEFNRFPDATAKENYERLALIMRDDVDSKLPGGSKKAKRRWYETNRVQDLSTLPTGVLRSYRRFATSLYPDVQDYAGQQKLDSRVLEELITRRDLNTYERDAFRLALDFNRAL